MLDALASWILAVVCAPTARVILRFFYSASTLAEAAISAVASRSATLRAYARVLKID